MLKTHRHKEDQAGQSEERKYWGKYVGFVRDNVDPEGRYRVRFYCPEVMGDRDHPDHWLPWALPSFQMAGGYNEGSAMVPPRPQDSRQADADSPRAQWACWIEFRHGDPRFPIYSGGFYFADDDLPGHSLKLTDANRLREGESSLQAPVGTAQIRFRPVQVDGDTAVIGDTVVASEPPPAADPVYPHNRAYKSPSGHAWELDDTPDAERIRCLHRSGSYWELTPDGSRVSTTRGRSFDYVSENEIRNVAGSSLSVVQGDRQEQVRQSDELVVDGTRRSVIGGEERTFNLSSFSHSVSGKYSMAAGNVELVSTEGIQATAAGGMALGAGERLDLVSSQIQAVGALMLALGCPTGVVLHGTVPAAGATEPIIGGLSLTTGLGALIGSVLPIITGYAATLGPPIVPPGGPFNEAAAWQLGVIPFLSGLLAVVSTSQTIHRVSKV